MFQKEESWSNLVDFVFLREPFHCEDLLMSSMRYYFYVCKECWIHKSRVGRIENNKLVSLSKSMTFARFIAWSILICLWFRNFPASNSMLNLFSDQTKSPMGYFVQRYAKSYLRITGWKKRNELEEFWHLFRRILGTVPLFWKTCELGCPWPELETFYCVVSS